MHNVPPFIRKAGPLWVWAAGMGTGEPMDARDSELVVVAGRIASVLLEQPDEGVGVFVTGTVGCLCHGDLLLIHQLLG